MFPGLARPLLKVACKLSRGKKLLPGILTRKMLFLSRQVWKTLQHRDVNSLLLCKKYHAKYQLCVKSRFLDYSVSVSVLALPLHSGPITLEHITLGTNHIETHNTWNQSHWNALHSEPVTLDLEYRTVLKQSLLLGTVLWY